MKFQKILYGTAYYYEYLPSNRLNEDIKMMKNANINVVRIGESTWSTYEPQEGVFDFKKLIKVIKAMKQADISVIVGTPTYAIPTWMYKKYPEIMLTDKSGKREYGARQLIDITQPAFLFFAERIIKNIVTCSSSFSNVIGYQLDNETKHFNTSSKNFYISFEKYLKDKYGDNLEKLNYDYGLDYWSNRINSWEDFPPINSTINGSLGAAFEKFQRLIVTKYLNWQSTIVEKYKKKSQFITTNFDFDWRSNSYGLNPYANHFDIANNLDVVAVDIYHPSQDKLTGTEISLFGDLARSTKNNNYIVMETQSQGFKNWVPYPGQLRLQAYSHIASGANMLSYWPWSSIHNGYETYWSGIIGHDFKRNPVYDEVLKTGNEFNKYSKLFVETSKKNKVAFIVSNESLTAIDWFPYRKINEKLSKHGDHQYNDILRAYYDPLYKLNVGCDILPINSSRISEYKLLIVPMLYSATNDELNLLNKYVENGGNILYTFRSGSSDENVKVRTNIQPAILSKSIGAEYKQVVGPEYDTENLIINGQKGLHNLIKQPVKYWMELLEPISANILAKYEHPYWKKYAAITENKYGKGTAFYLGTYLNEESIFQLYKYILKSIGLWSLRQEQRFPIINKILYNHNLKIKLDFYFNYSNNKINVRYSSNKEGISLFNGNTVGKNNFFLLQPWSLEIFVINN